MVIPRIHNHLGNTLLCSDFRLVLVILLHVRPQKLARMIVHNVIQYTASSISRKRLIYEGSSQPWAHPHDRKCTKRLFEEQKFEEQKTASLRCCLVLVFLRLAFLRACRTASRYALCKPAIHVQWNQRPIHGITWQRYKYKPDVDLRLHVHVHSDTSSSFSAMDQTQPMTLTGVVGSSTRVYPRRCRLVARVRPKARGVYDSVAWQVSDMMRSAYFGW